MTSTPPATFRTRATHRALGLAALAVVSVLAAGCSSDLPKVAGTTTTSAPATTAAPTTSEATTTTSTTLPPTTSTTVGLVTDGGIVKVANCSGVNGAAGGLTKELAKAGFTTREATNGVAVDADLKVSKIYVKPGSEALARSLSRLMGGVQLLPMPTPPWIQGADEGLGDATVLVMLGHDLAGKKLAAMAG